jgi:cytochrome c-type biogenesis protein CcmH
MLRPMRRLSLVLVLVILALATSPSAFAVQPNEILTDATLEARARALSRELRCMVCQNQSIDDSDAPLARDLRVLVRERLQAGDSDPQVIDFLVARYGEFVLLKPRFSALTAVLWLGPAVILLIGAFALFMAARRRSPESAAAAEPPQLSAAETARLSEILHSGDQQAGRNSR